MEWRSFFVHLLFPVSTRRERTCPRWREPLPRARPGIGVRRRVIKVTRLNGEEFYVNSDLIEFIEKTPDTVLTLTTGRKIVVKEDIPEIIKRITVFRGTLVRASLNLEENAEPEVDGKQELKKEQDEV